MIRARHIASLNISYYLLNVLIQILPMDVLNKILESKIVAIIRGADPSDAKKIVNALLDGGIKVLEITLNSRGALTVIEELSKLADERLLIGAGTVLDADAVNEAISAGAKFIISPCFDPAIITATKKHGVVSIPGAFTATEIFAAFKSGGDIIKVFPASGGSQYIRDIRGPFQNIPLMPTGGINLKNIEEYLQAGAVAVGIGSALVDTKKKITTDYLQELKSKAARYVELIKSFDQKAV
jgi:2-dehydro-3-deoxyphosphogluconate aldolase/(4S)-4-hydroxy-2-oxoglutarate aldolase